jgi:phage FluMu gp28-like protein
MDPAIPVIRWEPPAANFVDWPDEQRHRDMRDWLRENLKLLLAAMPDRPSWFGEDFGRNVDLTCIWPLTEAPGLTYRTPFVLELRDCPFSQQEQALFHVGNGLPQLCGGALDKGGNGAFLAERARQEFGPDIIEQVHFAEGWNLENWPPAKAALEDRTVIIPKNDDILDDFRAVKVVKGAPKVPRDARTTDRRDAGKRHGDSAIAFALALFAARKFDPGAGDWDVCTGGVNRANAIMRGY